MEAAVASGSLSMANMSKEENWTRASERAHMSVEINMARIRMETMVSQGHDEGILRYAIHG